MKKIILIIFMAMISSFSYYGAVNEKGEKVVDFTNSSQEENIIQEENMVEKEENTDNEIESAVDQKEDVIKKEIKQNTISQNEKHQNKNFNNNSQKQETEEKEKEQNKDSKEIVDTKKTESNNKRNTQEITKNTEIQSAKNVDLSKYSYYEKSTDGSYKAFIIDTVEVNKLKNLIDNAIKGFGYKNIKVIDDSSLLKDGTRYFTANKTNVENLVYDSEGFTIYYYAVKEYLVSPNGKENYFQTRSYIKVK